jgi:hypothetical protein
VTFLGVTRDTRIGCVRAPGAGQAMRKLTKVFPHKVLGKLRLPAPGLRLLLAQVKMSAPSARIERIAIELVIFSLSAKNIGLVLVSSYGHTPHPRMDSSRGTAFFSAAAFPPN